jgi:hypothetical protein
MIYFEIKKYHTLAIIFNKKWKFLDEAENNMYAMTKKLSLRL